MIEISTDTDDIPQWCLCRRCYVWNTRFQHLTFSHTYFILSSEINAYQKQIKVKSITSKMI